MKAVPCLESIMRPIFRIVRRKPPKNRGKQEPPEGSVVFIRTNWFSPLFVLRGKTYHRVTRIEVRGGNEEERYSPVSIRTGDVVVILINQKEEPQVVRSDTLFREHENNAPPGRFK